MISDSASTKSFGKRFLRQLKLEDVIFAPYLLAVTWQFFCGLPNHYFAWTLTAAGALAAWCAYVTFKSPDQESPSRAFWIVVPGPLVIIYILRALYPDVSFDVLNYHIFHAEQALRGPLVVPRDFFPTPAFFNPAPDLLTGFYRHVLGYRLGTISNPAAIVWLGIVLDRMLRQFIRGQWWRAVAILLVVCTEQIFFQLNNYMIDLLALPLLLVATCQALRRFEPASLVRRSFVIALLLGISVSFKLANLVFAIPIGLVFAMNIAVAHRRGLTVPTVAKLLALFGAVFLLPLVPFSVLMCRLTGNPFFPFYNAIFKSPFWPNTNVFDPRWGPNGLLEILLWPIIVFFKPERFCEFPVYSGRMSLGVIAALIGLVIARKDEPVRALCFITLLGALLWSAASGYSRYAVFVEITSGIIIVWLLQRAWNALAKFARPLRWLTAGVIGALWLAQVGLAFTYGNQYEWSMRTPLTARSMQSTLTDARELLRDRDLRTYLSREDQLAIDNVGAWIETNYKTTAFMALLKPDIPALGARTQEYFVTSISRKKFDDSISAAHDKRLFTLTETANLQKAREVLAARGLATGSIRPFSLPYFSRETIFDMLLVEVIPASREGAYRDSAPRGLPLPDNAFNASIRVTQVPLTLPAGTKYVLDVSLENASKIRWPGQQPTWQYQITVGNRWFTEDGRKVTDLDGRTALPDDLPPATSATLRLAVTAPATPGEYILELDAIQEGVAWFSDRGSATFRAKVKVN